MIFHKQLVKAVPVINILKSHKIKFFTSFFALFLLQNESQDIQDSLRFTHDVVGGK